MPMLISRTGTTTRASVTIFVLFFGVTVGICVLALLVGVYGGRDGDGDAAWVGEVQGGEAFAEGGGSSPDCGAVVGVYFACLFWR